MKNREYMMTLDDEHLESAIYHLAEGDFDLADEVRDPTRARTEWLSEAYDPEDRIWQIVNDENDDEWWDAQDI